MEAVLAVLLLLAVVAFIVVPLRRQRDPGSAAEAASEAMLADLEARKESKYREIRDAQLDHAQGKLSDADFERVDADLRAEAVEILKRLDEARAEAARQEG
jgi:hypothetical protein